MVWVSVLLLWAFLLSTTVHNSSAVFFLFSGIESSSPVQMRMRERDLGCSCAPETSFWWALFEACFSQGHVGYGWQALVSLWESNSMSRCVFWRAMTVSDSYEYDASLMWCVLSRSSFLFCLSPLLHTLFVHNMRMDVKTENYCRVFVDKCRSKCDNFIVLI